MWCLLKCVRSTRHLFSTVAMQPLITVVGATGTGKSKLAVEIAKHFQGEVINGDAMQLYRGLPIVTNKIPVHEREGIPHHLIDFIGLEDEPWRIGRFKKECLRVIQDIHSRGKIPVLVGGTSYYVQSVLFNDALLVGEGSEDGEEEEGGDNLTDQSGQPKSERLKSREGEEWAILDAPAETMLKKLQEVDPIMGDRWHINEVRKIRRSLEIFFETGRPASEIYEEQMRQRRAAFKSPERINAGQLRFPTLVFWVHADRGKLSKRLEDRVDTMAAHGLIAEAQSLSDYALLQEAKGNPVDLSRGIWVSIGYKELEPYFKALRDVNLSAKELEELKYACLESVKISTRQYSTRQTQWIRKKLWPALADIDATDKLFVLDTTDPGLWDTCVSNPVARIVQAFLHSEQLPDPKTLSPLANAALNEREQNYTKGSIPSAEALKQLTCKLCKKTMMGQDQWDIHIHAASHRRALKAAEKRARNAEWLQSHPRDVVVDGRTS